MLDEAEEWASPEDPHLLAIGWLLHDLDGDPDLARLEIVTQYNAVHVVQAFSDIALSLLHHSTPGRERSVVERWQREHVQHLIERDAGDREDHSR